MFERELIILIVQIIAALGVVVSVVYLGVQINQQNKITKAQFGHSLTQRLYERYFETSTNKDYAEFLAKDWNADDLTPTDITRIQMAVITYLVDIFDVYDKVQEGLVNKSHLETRMNTLKLGVMKTTAAKVVWSYWKNNREQSFIDWFESEIYDDEAAGNVSLEESLKMSKEVNTVR
ncbi:hypothetical protein M9C83_03980 [SAR86 cluster bacterium]|jgi:Ca2+-binding EF-hand superfamily protein|nr:hypothetical protein M9C83_03980 [SAR86 cluster bacterium]|tara:strand:- start:102 stop:632 length:531 start_codon:yes stop_codon:yes gene_type:complete